MTPADLLLWLLILTAAGGVLVGLWRGARHLVRLIVLSVHAFETIQRELKPNGGGSTYDLVRKLKTQSDNHEGRLDRIDATTDRAAMVAGLATSRAEHAAAVASEAAGEARAARAEMASNTLRLAADIARTQGALEGLERTLSLTVLTTKPTDTGAA